MDIVACGRSTQMENKSQNAYQEIETDAFKIMQNVNICKIKLNTTLFMSQ